MSWLKVTSYETATLTRGFVCERGCDVYKFVTSDWLRRDTPSRTFRGPLDRKLAKTTQVEVISFQILAFETSFRL